MSTSSIDVEFDAVPPPPPPETEADHEFIASPTLRTFVIATHSRFIEEAGWESEQTDGEEQEQVHMHTVTHGDTGTIASLRHTSISASVAIPSPSSSSTLLHQLSSPSVLTQRRFGSSDSKVSHRGSKSSRSDRSSRSKNSNSDSSADDTDSESEREERRRREEEDEDDEDDPDDKSMEPLPASVTFIARVCMCVLSLILLWITSLTLVNYIASSVVGSPAFAPVYDSWVAAFAVADRQASLHSECVERLIGECSQRLNASIVNAEAEWNKKEQARSEQIIAVQVNAQACDRESAAILQGINSWMTSGAVLQYEDAVCSAAEIESLRTLLNDRRVNKAGLNGLTSNYVTTTDDIFQQTASHVTVLQDYNTQFVSNQSEAVRAKYEQLGQQLTNLADPTALTASIEAQLEELKHQTERMRDCAMAAGKANRSVLGSSTNRSQKVVCFQITHS
jgi:hypothetical protein